MLDRMVFAFNLFFCCCKIWIYYAYSLTIMPDSGEWYGYIKGFSLWNCRQIQDGVRDQIKSEDGNPGRIIRCAFSAGLLLDQVEASPRKPYVGLVCWRTCWKLMYRSTYNAVYYTFVNSLSWMQSMLILVSRILHRITITQRVCWMDYLHCCCN